MLTRHSTTELYFLPSIKSDFRGWGDYLAVKNSYWSRGGPRLDSQYPYSASQLSVFPVPGDLTSYSGLYMHKACIWCTYKPISKMLIDIK